MANYKRKFPNNTTENENGREDPQVESTTTEDSVDRSSRIKPTKTRSATALRRNPEDLQIPGPIADFFNKQGYSLRWVSVVDNQTKSFSNKRVNQFITIGGDLVTPADIKRVDSSFLQGMVKYDYREEFADDDDSERGNQIGIRKGDLILMKLPLDYIEQRREDNAQMIQDQINSSSKEYLKRGLDVKALKTKKGLQNVSGSFFE